ncbi:MAG: hypothetical protein ACHQF4_05825 [Sphingobacteriales bacterium]
MRFIVILITLFIATVAVSQSARERKQNTSSQLNLKGRVKKIVETEYNATVQYGTGDKLGYSIYVFNRQGNQIERGNYNPDGSMKTLKSIFKYNSQGQRIETITVDQKGDSTTDKNAIGPIAVYTYDKNGNCTQWVSHMPNGEFANKVINKYDAFGNIIEYEFYTRNPDRWATKAISKYDAHHHEIVHKAYIEDGSLLSTYTHKYDSKGNEIEQLGYNTNGGLIFMETYKYAYDKNLNWTRKVIYKVNVLTSIVDREIKYY